MKKGGWIFAVQSLVLLVGIFVDLYALHRIQLLSNNSSIVQGLLISKSWQGHRIYNYTYTVDETEYQKSDRPDGLEDVGDNVLVYYYPVKPSISSLSKPEKKLQGIKNQLRMLFPIWIGVTGVFILVNFRSNGNK